MPRKPTTTTPPMVVINASSIMPMEEIRRNLSGQQDTMPMQAVMAKLMWQIAETQAIAADPACINPDHARGQSYALSLLALDLHRIMAGEDGDGMSD